MWQESFYMAPHESYLRAHPPMYAMCCMWCEKRGCCPLSRRSQSCIIITFIFSFIILNCHHDRHFHGVTLLNDVLASSTLIIPTWQAGGSNRASREAACEEMFEKIVEYVEGELTGASRFSSEYYHLYHI